MSACHRPTVLVVLVVTLVGYVAALDHLRGSPELSSLSRAYTEYVGGGAFPYRVIKIKILKVFFWEGGKGYASENDDNSGRPLVLVNKQQTFTRQPSQHSTMTSYRSYCTCLVSSA